MPSLDELISNYRDNTTTAQWTWRVDQRLSDGRWMARVFRDGEPKWAADFSVRDHAREWAEYCCLGGNRADNG